MKKIALLTLTCALAFAPLAIAQAASDMDHSQMQGTTDTSPSQAMEAITVNLERMHQDLQDMRDPGQRSTAFGTLNKHMMAMHHGMQAVEQHAEKTDNTAVQQLMDRLNKEMMVTMKHMGQLKSDPDTAIGKVEQGLLTMEKTVNAMKNTN